MIGRFSVSLEKNLLGHFDNYIRERHYTNRSEAVRDLIREALSRQACARGDKVVGVMSLVFDHHHRQLQDRLTQLQHEYCHLIVSSTHIHLDSDNCLEVIILRGKASEVNSLSNRLSALRGVQHGSLSICTPEPHAHNETEHAHSHG